MKIFTPEFITLDSGIPGKITTVMAWVHGNERSGIEIIQSLPDVIHVVSGKVFLIIANPRAIEQNVRQTEKNMNRSFHNIPQGSTYEDLRAQEIIPYLKQSDYLLDIHNTTNTENSIPFLISEHPKYDNNFPVEIVVSGLDILHPGWSDGYMNSIGKVGLCIESGSIHFDDDGKVARESVMNFLRTTGNIECVTTSVENQKRYHLDTIIKAKTDKFRFVKKWLDFESVREWELVAFDWDEEIIAPYNGVIVFPHIPKNIGDEMCVFGK